MRVSLSISVNRLVDLTILQLKACQVYCRVVFRPADLVQGSGPGGQRGMAVQAAQQARLHAQPLAAPLVRH